MHSARFGPVTGFTVGWLFSVSRIASYALISQIMLDYAAERSGPRSRRALPRAAAITVFTIVLDRDQRPRRHARRLGRQPAHDREDGAARPDRDRGAVVRRLERDPGERAARARRALEAMNLALFACVGFDVAAIVSGEMRDPRRDLPISILGGLAISGLLYLLLMLACFGILADTAASKLPLADVAEHLVGPAGRDVDGIRRGHLTCGRARRADAGLAAQHLCARRSGRPAASDCRGAPRLPHAARRDHRLRCVLSWLLAITGAFKYLLAIFVIARMLVYGSTAAALIVLRRREGPAPVPVPGGVGDLGARPRRLRRPRRDAVLAGGARRRDRRRRSDSRSAPSCACAAPGVESGPEGSRDETTRICRSGPCADRGLAAQGLVGGTQECRRRRREVARWRRTHAARDPRSRNSPRACRATSCSRAIRPMTRAAACGTGCSTRSPR